MWEKKRKSFNLFLPKSNPVNYLFLKYYLLEDILNTNETENGYASFGVR